MSETDGWSTIRPIIEEKLSGVSGIGRVYPYLTHSKFSDKYRSQHLHEGKLNTWQFTRSAMTNQHADVGNRSVVGDIYRRDHRVTIIGRVAVSESGESEVEFQDLSDMVVAAFESDTRLSGRLLVGHPPSIESVSHEMYGGTLVHRVSITFVASERVSR